MKVSDYVLYGFLSLIVLGLIVVFISTGIVTPENTSEKISEQALPAKSSEAFQTISSGTTNMGDIEITLTPTFNENQLIVKFSANTHSVTLSDYDLKKLTSLHYGEKTLRPIEVPKMSGHHVSGSLVFAIDEKPDRFSILIEGIPALEQREFEW